MNIQEQWEQDVKDFGDNACLMYKVRAEHNSACLVNAMNNPHVISRFSNILRKQSAELPFDLERVKNRDEVLITIRGEQLLCETSYAIYLFEYGATSDLCMKYPPKVLP